MDIHILYNNCYGGFFPSEQAIKLYNVRRTAIDPEFKAILYGNEFQRHDPILVHIFIELGEDFGHSFSKTAIYTCGKEYERYYEIRDYDGMERVSIDIRCSPYWEMIIQPMMIKLVILSRFLREIKKSVCDAFPKTTVCWRMETHYLRM